MKVDFNGKEYEIEPKIDIRNLGKAQLYYPLKTDDEKIKRIFDACHTYVNVIYTKNKIYIRKDYME